MSSGAEDGSFEGGTSMNRHSSRGAVSASLARSSSRIRSRLRRAALVAIATAAFPVACGAHVKWFVSYNLFAPPRPLEHVVTSEYFVRLGLAVVVLMFAVAAADRYLCERSPALQRQLREISARAAPWLAPGLRFGVAIFLTAAFAFGCTGRAMILTPELHTPRDRKSVV